MLSCDRRANNWSDGFGQHVRVHALNLSLSSSYIMVVKTVLCVGMISCEDRLKFRFNQKQKCKQRTTRRQLRREGSMSLKHFLPPWDINSF